MPIEAQIAGFTPKMLSALMTACGHQISELNATQAIQLSQQNDLVKTPENLDDEENFRRAIEASRVRDPSTSPSHVVKI